jgi:lysophospholipase L1-like esterase/cytochrome c oxidase subunit IV
MQKANSTGRSVPQILGLLAIVFGAIFILSALVINPPVFNRLFPGDNTLMKGSVLLLYFWTSLIVGLILAIFGILTWKRKSAALATLSLALFVLGALIISDRLLLVKFGLCFFKADPELHYGYRPGALQPYPPRGWARINAYGFNDREFPQVKPAGELRGLVLGNSIAMGHGVDQDSTFAKCLERILMDNAKAYPSCHVINAAVQGYSTTQEYISLKRCTVFDPDFVLVEYCLNDVTEPFFSDPKFGAKVIDYHGVVYTRFAPLGYLLNETGYGRLIQRYLFWKRGRRQDNTMNAMYQEYNVFNMVQHCADNPKIVEGWKISLGALEEIYRFCRERDLPIVLLIFPYTFQFGYDEYKEPQRILAAHAAEHNVLFLDLTSVFEKRLLEAHGDSLRVLNQATGRTWKAPAGSDNARSIFAPYFLDQDHLTTTGHQIVAEEIYRLFQDKGILTRGSRVSPHEEISIRQ